MKVYLHLADSGLVLADLALRAYDESGSVVSTPGVTLTPLLTGVDYVLDNVPGVSSVRPGVTLTFEQPAGVYHAYRFGISESQPSHVIIPIREIVASPATELQIKVFRDGIEVSSGLSVSQLAVDGECIVSGWESPSALDEQWSVRWVYGGQTYAVQWTGVSVSNLDHTSYIVIEAVQRPFLLPQLDAEGRSIYSVNFVGCSNGRVSAFEDEIAKLLDVNDIATLMTDLFIGVVTNFPNGNGPYTQIINTGGRAPDQTHDNSLEEYPRIQVLVRAKGNKAARDKIFAIYELIDKMRNVSLSA